MYQLKELKKSLFWCLLLNCFIIHMEIKLEIGDYLVCTKKHINNDYRPKATVGKKYPVIMVEQINMLGFVDDECAEWESDPITIEGFDIEKPTTWTPTMGDMILVSDYEDDEDWSPRVFIMKYKNHFIVENADFTEEDEDSTLATSWKYGKPLNPTIPYLKEIEALIQKSNEESEFSVITLNIEKKCI